MKLIRVRRGMTFTQEDFLKSFIEECTSNRKRALTPAEQELWKFIVNCIYGKVSNL